MAASFHQRVVVGSDDQSLGDADADAAAAGVGRRQETPRKPGRDLSRPYQDKTREELVSLLQSRDATVKDLNEYIGVLLARVMDECPKVLETPERKSKK